jgi:RNA polymerase sigma-70 factor (ECF subfamily)
MSADGDRVIAWDWAELRAASAREARRVARSADDADEITQEAIVRAWRRRDTCRAPDNPVPWVVKITRMEAYRHLERGANRRRREGAELSEAQLAALPGDSDSLLMRLSVSEALAVLSTAERALITARYVDDLTQAAVADRLGMPEGTAKVRLHRIRRVLRAALEETA